MKVLFINRSDIGGGAATTMQRLALDLRSRYKTSNYFLVSIKRTRGRNVYKIRLAFYQKVIERVLEKFLRIIGLPYTFLPFSSKEILNRARKIKPDVISLHNIHGGYFQTSILPKLSKLAPIVWTFHDMWPVTRNAAHTFGNQSWKRMQTFNNEKDIYPSIGLDTGNLLLRWKRGLYKKTRMLVVTPSFWLEGICKESPLLKNKKTFHISHGIDLSIFKPGNKISARKELGIDEEAKIIMFGTDFVRNNPFKAGKLLFDVLKNIDKYTKDNISILVVGSGGESLSNEFKNLKMIPFGRAKSENEMALCYQASDCLISPSRADNLPLVLIEATACGTPCVAYGVGGVNEIISDGKSGYVVKPYDVRTFSLKVLDILSNKKLSIKMSKKGREVSKEKFRLREMTSSYYGLFRSLIHSKQREGIKL